MHWNNAGRSSPAVAGATAQNPFSLLVAARSQPHGDGMRKPRALKSDSGKIGTPDIRTTYQEIGMPEQNKPVSTLRVTYPVVLTAAARDVLAERRRQVEVEGFTPDRDDDYGDGALSAAAGSYALHAFDRRVAFTPAWWPWARAWWKPGTPRQMLVKAGALILAAIEQIDRRAAK